MRRFCILLSLILTLPLTGCPKKDKDERDNAPPPATHEDARYVPMGTGDRWVYETSSWMGGGLPATGREELFQVFGTAPLNGVDTIQLTTLLGNDWSGDQQRHLRITSQGLWEYFPPDSPFATLANPLQLLRFPLVAGDRFVAFSELSEGTVEDLDDDGIPESRETRITVTVVGQESVSTPAGDFTGTWKINRVAEWLTHYSTGHTSATTSTVDEWLARDIGLVKRDTTVLIGGGSGSLPVMHGQRHALLRYELNGVRSETTPPQVEHRYPAAGSMNPPATSVSVDFDELLDVSGINADAVRLFDESGIPVEGDVTGNHHTASFNPAAPLAPGNYTVRIAGIRDAIGNTTIPQEWTITVVPVEDCFEGDVFVCWTL